MLLSIIIPAFNEEETIEEVIRNLDNLDLGNLKKEIIVIDDGSTDSTVSRMRNAKVSNSKLEIIKHDKNQGKGAAVWTGMKRTKGDIVLIQDADLEYNPEEIPKLLDPILSGKAKVVYGTRLRVRPIFFGKDKTPFLLNFFGNKFLSIVTSVLYGSYITDMETGYKVFKKSTLRGIRLKSKSFDFEPEITAKFLKRNIKILEIDITTRPRGYDEGKKIRPIRDGSIAFWTLIKYRFVD